GGSIGERRFEREAAECSDLTDSILLVIALTIDPAAGERGLPAELLGLLAQEQEPGAALLADLEDERAERAAEAAEQPAVAVNADPPAAPQRAARSEPEPAVGTRVEPGRPLERDHAARWAIDLALAAAASAGVQPAIDLGASATVRLSTPWPIAFELGASYWLPSAAPLAKPAVRGESVDFQAALATLTACVPVVSARVRISACAGGLLGARWTSGGVAVGAGASTRAFFGPATTVDARYALTRRWFALVAVSVVGAFPRDRFIYTDGLALRQPLYDPSAVAGWVALGLGVRL
ncbi:MAG TPA: hypothetical protein VK509_01070, partial [Polyangiales bacterium]|nr:hypothetical protein [Polyangiales bacterium]